MARSSIAASTTAAVLSCAMNRTFTWLVGVRPSDAKLHAAWFQPLVVPGPVGPTVSARVQDAPLFKDTSTRNALVPGLPPWSFEYQRQYETTVLGPAPERLYVGLVRMV